RMEHKRYTAPALNLSSAAVSWIVNNRVIGTWSFFEHLTSASIFISGRYPAETGRAAFYCGSESSSGGGVNLISLSVFSLAFPRPAARHGREWRDQPEFLGAGQPVAD